MNTRLFHLGKLNQTVDCVELGLRSAEISAEIEISLPKNQPLPKLTKICYLPPRMLEAIIRSFPDRVLTVTVLAPHKSGQKRALSFDSCLPPEPATTRRRRWCAQPQPEERVSQPLRTSSSTTPCAGISTRPPSRHPASYQSAFQFQSLTGPVFLTALPPLGLLPEPAALPPIGL